MKIGCRERVNAYFENMNKYNNDIEIRVRFLDKIYKAALDPNYTREEHEMVLKMLLDDSNKTIDQDYKILDLCYCYKIKQAINSNIEIPVLKSFNIIKGSRYEHKEIPEGVREILISRNNKSTFAFNEAQKPDEDCLNLYNVYISKDHFYYKGN